MRIYENAFFNLFYRTYSLSYILIIFSNFIFYNQINSYIIFPLEYLNDRYYKLNENNNIKLHDKVIQQIYYRNFITKIKIGTPSIDYSLFLDSNNDKYYITSINNSTKKEENKYADLYNFNDKDYYNELLSTSYKKIMSYYKTRGFDNYYEICLSQEKIIFATNNNSKELIIDNFPIKITRIHNDDYIPGKIGLMYNNTYSEYDSAEYYIQELKRVKLIDNYYWFFNFDEISPLNKKLKGQLIIGSLPHEFSPKEFSIEDYIYTNSYKILFGPKSWTIKIDKVHLNNDTQNYKFKNTNIVLSYEINNIIGNIEFHDKIKEFFMNELLEKNKCFIGNFIDKNSNQNMTFYYCDKSVQDILYQNLENIKFDSVDLEFTFELTKGDLLYIKDNYIYLMVLFNEHDDNYWIMGQIFLTKYNFVFNIDKQQIGLYKKVNKIKKDIFEPNNSNNINYLLIVIIISIIIAFIFCFIGLYLGKKMFGFRRKTLANELKDEIEYEYKPHNDDEIINNV